MESLLIPRWPAPANIRAATTTREGGFSSGPWQSFNLGTHVGDDPAAVVANRGKLQAVLGLERPPLWLNQVHGTAVFPFNPAPGEANPATPTADASCTHTPGVACTIMTADCLPVIFCNRTGTVVAAAHGGWRGLAAGVLRATVKAMGVEPGEIIAWLGPAISQEAFEVGAEVAEAFAANSLGAAHRNSVARCFRPAALPGKFLADLYGLAREELQGLGVSGVYGGEFCTFGDKGRFYSFRRDGETGRMATLVWMTGC